MQDASAQRRGEPCATALSFVARLGAQSDAKRHAAHDRHDIMYIILLIFYCYIVLYYVILYLYDERTRIPQYCDSPISTEQN